jgi:transposase
MTETTRQEQSTAVRTLYVAFELGHATWRLAMTTDRGERPRHYTVAGGDVTAALGKLARARTLWDLPAGGRVVSCYEAGRDGFWLHRCLTAHGVTTVVVDPTSIERDARAKHVKTDRVDAERLVALLVDWDARGKRLRVVRVPSVAEEDARHADRELATAKGVRTAITNRITGLLIAQGVRVCAASGRALEVAAVRLWDGSPVPPGLRARLEREVAARDAVQQRIAALERARRVAIAAQATPAAVQMAQLMRLVGMGANGASRFVVEFFAWRAFRNGREIGALAGLTPTPYASGARDREQGISKAGNARVRTMAIELAWCWLRFQPQSALARWFQERYGGGGKRQRRIGIVAVARKLLIALWRYLETGQVPEGARVSRAA